MYTNQIQTKNVEGERERDCLASAPGGGGARPGVGIGGRSRLAVVVGGAATGAGDAVPL